MRRLNVIVLLILAVVVPSSASTTPGRIRLEFDTSEADAVLAMLAKYNAGDRVTDDDWRRLFALSRTGA